MILFMKGMLVVTTVLGLMTVIRWKPRDTGMKFVYQQRVSFTSFVTLKPYYHDYCLPDTKGHWNDIHYQERVNLTLIVILKHYYHDLLFT